MSHVSVVKWINFHTRGKYTAAAEMVGAFSFIDYWDCMWESQVQLRSDAAWLKFATRELTQTHRMHIYLRVSPTLKWSSSLSLSICHFHSRWTRANYYEISFLLPPPLDSARFLLLRSTAINIEILCAIQFLIEKRKKMFDDWRWNRREHTRLNDEKWIIFHNSSVHHPRCICATLLLLRYIIRWLAREIYKFKLEFHFAASCCVCGHVGFTFCCTAKILNWKNKYYIYWRWKMIEFRPHNNLAENFRLSERIFHFTFHPVLLSLRKKTYISSKLQESKKIQSRNKKKKSRKKGKNRFFHPERMTQKIRKENRV